MCCIEKIPIVDEIGGARGYASMQLMNMYIVRQTYQTTQDVRQMNYSFWRPITHFPYHDLWTLSCVRGGGVWGKHVSSFAGIMVMSWPWELFAYYSNEVSGFNTDPTRLSAWRPPHADSVRGHRVVRCYAQWIRVGFTHSEYGWVFIQRRSFFGVNNSTALSKANHKRALFVAAIRPTKKPRSKTWNQV